MRQPKRMTGILPIRKEPNLQVTRLVANGGQTSGAHGKEGSPVRVRKRALQKRRMSALFVQIELLGVERAVGMEPRMEPLGSRRTAKPFVLVSAAMLSQYPSSRSSCLLSARAAAPPARGRNPTRPPRRLGDPAYALAGMSWS